MIFEGVKVIELVKKPINDDSVKKGRQYESKIRILTEYKSKDDLRQEDAWNDFKESMRKRISVSKSIRIEDFFSYPLTVVQICESLTTDLYKVFDAGNSFFSIDTVKRNGGDKIHEVLKKIDIKNWIEENGKQIIKNKPNTIIVVDKDKDGVPYLISVDNERLIDFELKEDGVTFEFIVFHHSNNKIAVYDDKYYHIVRKEKEKFILEDSIVHKGSKCPARMFMDNKLNSQSEIRRQVPISLALSKLEEWQVFDIYKFYTDHFAPFPVTEMVRSSCGDDRCHLGVISVEERWEVNGVEKVSTKAVECERCKENNTIGVGTLILLEPQEEDEKSASGKFRMISNDVSQLDYLQKKLNLIEDYIKKKVVGTDEMVMKEAVNEKQVQGSFESKTNVLLSLKENLDNVYAWIATTIGDLYIKGKPLSVSANYGTEWYLTSEQELLDRYKTAAEANLPKEELNMFYRQIIDTKYKGNPDKIRRLKIIAELDPLPHICFESKLKMLEKELISKQDLIISERLPIFVAIFEEQNGSISDFGIEKDIKSVVRIIKDKIIKISQNEAE